jgi:hypothetical protein
MLSDAKSEGEFFRFGSGHLLSDLVTFTRLTTENANTKIIFVGDPCQLPPVGDDSSKAFDSDYLKDTFGISSEETEMKEVKRQGGESGILKAAAKIRRSISSGFFNDFNLQSNDNDLLNPSWENFLESWKKAKRTKVIIAYKNKTCLDLNLQIRKNKYGQANLPVQKGDIVILGANNHRKGVFNGEFAVVNEVGSSRISRTIHLRGKDSVTLSWRAVELLLPDSESDNKMVTGMLLENFLYGDNTLRPDERQALYVDFKNRHKGLKRDTEEFKLAIMQDDFFNCLQIKYGYAVTCHKAQGGEWDDVFVVWDHDHQKDFNAFTDKQPKQSKNNPSFYRWAYTAVTRASNTLHALNPPFFNSYSSMSFLDVEVVNSLNELTGTKLQAEEIILDEELWKQLSPFDLINLPVQLQDHFITVRHAVRKHYVEIDGWEKKNMEVFYKFKRESQTAALKTWINKNNVFNGKYQKLPASTNSDELYASIETLLKNLPAVVIKRNTAETILSKIEFDQELEEQFPFTRNLFDDVTLLLKETEIIVDDIDHQQYKERYTFKRTQEVAVIDFEYKKNGFFGRVVPIQNKSNSQALIADIKTVLQTFKQEDYAS